MDDTFKDISKSNSISALKPQNFSFVVGSQEVSQHDRSESDNVGPPLACVVEPGVRVDPEATNMEPTLIDTSVVPVSEVGDPLDAHVVHSFDLNLRAASESRRSEDCLSAVTPLLEQVEPRDSEARIQALQDLDETTDWDAMGDSDGSSDNSDGETLVADSVLSREEGCDDHLPDVGGHSWFVEETLPLGMAFGIQNLRG